jgi:hypothetical protein
MSRKSLLVLVTLQALRVGHDLTISIFAQVLQRPTLQSLKELQSRSLLDRLDRDLESRQGYIVMNNIVGQYERAHGHVAVSSVGQDDLVEMCRNSNVGGVSDDFVFDVVFVVGGVLVGEVQRAGDDIDVCVAFCQDSAEVFEMCPVYAKKKGGHWDKRNSLLAIASDNNNNDATA